MKDEDYIKMICPYCKNKDTNLCEIHVTINGTMKCPYYERKRGDKDEVKQ